MIHLKRNLKMKGLSISSFSQAEVDFGTRLFKFLATNGEYVTADQMGAFLRQSNLGNQRLSPLWEKTIGASRKNFQLIDTLYLLRMLAIVQQGKELDDEVLSGNSFECLADLSFFPFDSGFDVDSIEDSQSSTPTGSVYLKNQGSNESPLRDASRLQNVQQVTDLSISRCISLNNEATADPAPTESMASIMHAGVDDLASHDLAEHPGTASHLFLTDSTVPPALSHASDRHSDARESVDTRAQQDDTAENSKQHLPHASSPVPVVASSMVPTGNSSILSSFVEIAKHFQGALLQTQEMVDRVIDASNPLGGLIVVPPEQIVVLKKRLSEMSKKLIDQLNTLSDQGFTSSLSSCLKGLESLSNALTMLISKEKQVIKMTNEIICYLDGSDSEEGPQVNDSQGTCVRGTSTDGSETDEKCTQDCSEVDNGNTYEKLKSSKGTFSSHSENILSTAASIFPATTAASSSATYQDGEKLPPVHPPLHLTSVKKKSLIKLVQDTREVVDKARNVEASYARAQEANRMYKSFSESLETLLQTELETNTNLEEQQKKLEKKANEKTQLITKQLEQLKSILSEQAIMFTSILSAKLSSPNFMDQLNLFTIDLADKAVSEMSRVLAEAPKLESLSVELKNLAQARFVKESAQGHTIPLEIPETPGSDSGQHRGSQSSYNTFSHKVTSTRAELVAQQTIRSIVRDELRSLKGELIEEIKTMICGIIGGEVGVRGNPDGSIPQADAALAPVESGRLHPGSGNSIANTPSLPVTDRLKPWTYHFGSNMPSS